MMGQLPGKNDIIMVTVEIIKYNEIQGYFIDSWLWALWASYGLSSFYPMNCAYS